MRHVRTLLLTAAVILAASLPATAVQQPPAGGPGAKTDRIKVCSLLTRAEVKKLMPWAPHVDQIPSEEEPIGATGSSCNYPTVFIQVLPFSQQTIDTARKTYTLESVSGVGDEAYFRNNRDRYAELYVKTGKHLLTLQVSIGTGETAQSVKPRVVALAQALVEKLR